jgi:hypothetical protein
MVRHLAHWPDLHSCVPEPWVCNRYSPVSKRVERGRVSATTTTDQCEACHSPYCLWFGQLTNLGADPDAIDG